MATTKARVVLGQRPATIRRTVSAHLPDGSPCLIEVDFKYRTRKEYGELLDERMKAAEASDAERRAQAGDNPTPLTAGDLQRMSVTATAEHILDIATGWGLPEPFDLVHVTQLCDELPGVASAIVDDYRAAITEGRRGN